MIEGGPVVDHVVDALRTDIIEGSLVSDDRLKDLEIATRFAVSRTTAREALRLLVREGLAASRLNAGVTVRRLELDEVRDIYRVRRLVELAALDQAPYASEQVFKDLARHVEDAEKLDDSGDLRSATSSLRFHQTIVQMAQSPLLDAFFANVSAQLRLALGLISESPAFQGMWIPRDRQILDHVLAGRTDSARYDLQRYLEDSEARLLAALRARLR